MPRAPKFRHYTALPFELRWNDKAGLWELDLPEATGPKDLPAVQSDIFVKGREIFYFGPGNLEKIRVKLQDWLARLTEDVRDTIPDFPECVVLRSGSNQIIVNASRLDVVARHLKLTQFLKGENNITLTGASAEKTYASLREHLVLMAQNRSRPPIQLKDIRTREFGVTPTGYSSFHGQMSDLLMTRLREMSVWFLPDGYHSFLMMNTDVPALERLAETEMRAKLIREREVAAYLQTEEFRDAMPRWLNVSIVDGRVVLSCRRSLLQCNIRLKMNKIGFTGGGGSTMPGDPLRETWHILVTGDTGVMEISSMLSEAAAHMEKRMRDNAKKAGNQGPAGPSSAN